MIEIKKRGEVWEAFYNGALIDYSTDLGKVVTSIMSMVDEIEEEENNN